MDDTGDSFGKGHLLQLDGLRGLAILFVLGEHTLGGRTRDSIHSVLDVASRLACCGWVGVDLFFVLSGFLITRILLETQTAPRRYATFYARRALRIWPLYYAVVLVAFVALPYLPGALSGARGDYAWLPIVFLCQNIVAVVTSGVPVPPMLAVTWSLAIEEQFYFIWPTVVFRLSRAWIRRLAVTVCVFSPIARLALAAIGVTAGGLYYWTATRLDGLALGALVALYATDSSASPKRLAALASRTIWLAIPTAALLLVRFGGAHPIQEPRAGSAGLATAFVYSLVGASFVSILALAVARPRGWLGRSLRAGWLRWLGKISYSLYLIHLPIFWLTASAIGTAAPRWVTPLVGVIVALALAHLSCRYLESPFLRFKPAYRAKGDFVAPGQPDRKPTGAT